MMVGGNIWISVFLLGNMFILGMVVAFAYSHARAHTRRHNEPKQVTLPMLPHDVRQRIIDEAESDYEKVLRRSAISFQKDLELTADRLNSELSKISSQIIEKEMTRYKTELTELRSETAHKLGGANAEIDAHQAEINKKLTERQAAMDAELAQHRHELETKLTERAAQLERDLADMRADYSKKQAALEADFAQKEAELANTLKTREAQIAGRQSELEQDLVVRQQAFLAKQKELEDRLEAELQKRRETYMHAIDTKLGDAVSTFLVETMGRNVDLGAQLPYLIAELDAHKQELIAEVAPNA